MAQENWRYTLNNVDPGEIAKFDALANRWWDTTGEFKPLHDINPLRANFIDQHSPVAGKTILDIGCGGGILSEALAQRGGIVTGIDMAPTPLAIAKQHSEMSGLKIDYQLSSAEDFAKSNEQYDIVTCLEMLEHVPEPASVIASCAKLLKPGGHLYLSTINRNPKSYAFAVIGAEYILKLLPKGTHDYDKFIRPAEMAQWCRDSGLRLVHTTGMTYNPFSKRYRLNDRDVSVNYLMYLTND